MQLVPPFIGCFKDDMLERDLKVFVGSDMKVKQCFDKAKSLGLPYAALQNGNLCIAGTRVLPTGSSTRV